MFSVLECIYAPGFRFMAWDGLWIRMDIGDFALADGLYQRICWFGATREEKHQPLVAVRGWGGSLINTTLVSDFWNTCLHENWEPQVDDGKELTLNTSVLSMIQFIWFKQMVWNQIFIFAWGGKEKLFESNMLSSSFAKSALGLTWRITLQRICLGYVMSTSAVNI